MNYGSTSRLLDELEENEEAEHPIVRTWEQDTYAAAIACAEALCAAGFAHHILEEIGANEWWCHKPGTGDYSFRVIVRHSMVCIYGDCGEAIFRGGEASGNRGGTLGWLKRAAHNRSYLFSKRQPPQTQFYAGDVLDYALEQVEEGRAGWRKLLREAVELYDDGRLDKDAWDVLLCRHDPDCHGWEKGIEPSGLMLIEALKWLVEHLPAEVAE